MIKKNEKKRREFLLDDGDFPGCFVAFLLFILFAIGICYFYDKIYGQSYIEPNCLVLWYCGEEPNGTDPNCGCIAQFNKPRVDPPPGPALIDVDIRLAVMAQQWLQRKPASCPATPWYVGRGNWNLIDLAHLAAEWRKAR